MPDRSDAASLRRVLYLRQSTYREDSISLELQEQVCRDYCTSRGYPVVAVLADPGVSGLQLDKRPGMRRAIEAVEAGEADGIVVYRWSRLSRRQLHQAVILDRIERAGGIVEAATEPADTATASGKFGRNVLLAAAAFESEQKSEQWREAQARRVKRGLPSGGAPPFGYVKGENRGDPFRPDPVRGPVLAEMYADYLRGHGPQRIARDLNARGVRSVRGNELSVVTISRILDSGFAAGLIPLDVNVRDADGKRRTDVTPRHEQGAHDAVIDLETWDAYKRERDRRRKVHPKSRQPKWHLGGGLTRCSRCGSNLFVNTYGTKSQALCSAYKSKRTCPGVWINRATVENHVALWLGGRVDEWADRQDEVQQVDDERSRVADEIERVRAKLDAIDAGRKVINRQTARGLITEAEAEAALSETEIERHRLAASIDACLARQRALSPDADVYERLIRGAESQTPDEWNVILKRVIREVAVSPTTLTIAPWVGEPAVYVRSRLTSKSGPQSSAVPST